MRPGISRAFSTTRRIAQQPLYELYIPELNETQKAALRKIARKNEPNFHGHMNKDALWLLAAFNRSESQKKLLKDTLQRIRDIVKQHAGPKFDVEDIGMHTYSCQMHDAPFEFAIVDKSRPDGVSPEEVSTELPIVYDASRFSEVLMQEGFQGGFWAPPWDTEKRHRLYQSRDLIPPAARDLTTPWPEYHRPSLREFHYPVRMITFSPIPFSLTLPGPSVMRLNRFIKTYFKVRVSMVSLMAMLFAWTRSHRMDEFTPQCLALMVIRFMQEMEKVPNLMDPDHPFFKSPKNIGLIKPPSESKIWVPFQYHLKRPEGAGFRQQRECRLELTQLEHTIMDFKKFRVYKQKPGPLFWDFLYFWRNGGLISSTFALSVGQNKYIRRQRSVFSDRDYQSDLSDFFQKLEYLAQRDGFDTTLPKYDPRLQPFSWRLQPLVVQDPFIPTYNHAESVSRESMLSFVRLAQMTTRDLSHSWPFMGAFGQYYDPDNQKKADIFKRKRASAPRTYHVSAVRSEPANRIFEITQPPQPVLAARAKTIQRVQAAIQKTYGKQYKVQAFGSTEYGVSTAKSDLDLVIIDPARMDGFSPRTNLPKIYNIRKLSSVLRRAGFAKVTAIPTASVPIVKFADKATGLDCDINVNEQLGRLNTSMIKRYCDIVPILRPMVAYIKHWAKPLGLNKSSTRNNPTFSSYALMLMTISYLQSRGLAPNLQDGFKYNPHARDGVFWTLRMSQGTRVAVPCDTRYHLGHGWVAKEKVNYQDALKGWFQYWGNEHSYSTCVVSVREGGFRRSPEKQGSTTPTPQSQKLAEQLGQSQEPLDSVVQGSREHTTDVQVTSQTVQGRDPPSSSDALGSAVAEDAESRNATDLPADRHESEESPISLITPGLSLTDRAPDNVSKDTHSYPDFPVVDQLSKSIEKLPRELEKPRRALPFPLFVLDPFIRTKVVTQAISGRAVDIFRMNCKGAARILSCGGSLETLVSKKKGHKMTPAPSAVPDNESMEADFALTKVHVEVTPDIIQRYPGAVARGADEHASPLVEIDPVSTDDKDDIDYENFFDDQDFFDDKNIDENIQEEEEAEVLTLPEFEPEGFGLKKCYFDGMVSSTESIDGSTVHAGGTSRGGDN